MPASVKIGSMTYRVSDSVEDLNEYENKLQKSLAGASHGPSAIIVINPKHDSMYKRQTLVHEIVHQVFESVAGWSPKNEEKICRVLEAGLLGVIRENPGLIAWLQSE